MSAISGEDFSYPRQASTLPDHHAPRSFPKTINVSTLVGDDVKYLAQAPTHPEHCALRSLRTMNNTYYRR